MTMFWVGLLACFPSIRESEEERFIDNPQHYFDGDTYTEEDGDCDDRNPDFHPGNI